MPALNEERESENRHNGSDRRGLRGQIERQSAIPRQALAAITDQRRNNTAERPRRFLCLLRIVGKSRRPAS